jgi:peptide-methionine (S)-S-oxide reductase
MALLSKKSTMPAQGDALPGRNTPLPLSGKHFVNGSNIKQPAIGGLEEAVFGLGCFWGAERKFWQIPGVVTTAVGYAGGFTPNATYEEVCSGHTGHTEAVRVVYDPNKVSYETLLKAFWESHDPTQGMRQGGDIGTQYRSAIYTTTAAQHKVAEASRRSYQEALTRAHRATITTEIRDAPEFYYAEEYHQQYLAKNPNGYCGLGGCGVSYQPVEPAVGEKA